MNTIKERTDLLRSAGGIAILADREDFKTTMKKMDELIGGEYNLRFLAINTQAAACVRVGH